MKRFAWSQFLRSLVLRSLFLLLAAGPAGIALADDDDRVPPPRVLPPSVGVPREKVVDLTLTVAPELPCVWPLGMTPMAVIPTATFPRTGRHQIGRAHV